MYITCSHCEGKDNNCPVCKGLCVSSSLMDKVLVWQKNLSRSYIYNKRLWKTIKKIIDIFLFVFCILGFLVVVYFLYIYLRDGGDFFDFFVKQHIILTLFWLVILVATYIFYRMSSEKPGEHKVIKKLIDKIEEEKDLDIDEQDIWGESKLEKVNVAQAFSFETISLIEKSYLKSIDLNQPLKPIHLLHSILQESKIRAYFFRLGIDTKILKERLEKDFPQVKQGQGIDQEVIKIFLLAYTEAYNTKQEYVGIEEVLVALSKTEGLAREILFDLEIDDIKLENMVEWSRVQAIISKRWRGLQQRAVLKPKGQVNRAYTAVASPFLDQFSEDLTQYAGMGYLEPTIGKEKELKTLFSYFNSGRSGVMLVGKPGTGKSFVVDSLAELMAAEEVPKIFQDKRLVRLSVSALVAGASKPGAIEARLLAVLKEVQRAGNIILVIDNIDSLVGLGTETSESLDVAEMLSGELQKGYFLLVAAIDEDKFKKHLSKTSLSRVLAKVDVLEPERNQAIRILESKAPIFENKYGIYFTYQALEATFDFSIKYIHNLHLPAKAVTILEQVAQVVRQSKGEKALVDAEDVAKVVSQITKVPVTKVTEIESKKLLNLEQEMHKRVVDQVEGVEYIAEALRRARANLRTGKRPIASFLFLGPTGVGKTEVAKTLSEIYFGGESNMIRLDMSEYGVVGALPRVIEYLTDQVKERPFALVLLDEFEKADPEVHNLFLQVMEDGRLTNSKSETIDFTNTIIIGTSNAGSDLIQQGLKNNININNIKQDLIENKLNKFFRPELINRFDGVIVFKPLSPDDVKKITILMLNKLAQNISDKGIQFIFTDQVVAEIAKLGFDPAFGARPLCRVIQDKIENEIAKLILSKQVDRRDKIVLNKIGDIQVEKAVRI
ncbi:MAG: ATP-dependent Clp protease ATP-binding subunit [Patescibacteria group bacterium]